MDYSLHFGAVWASFDKLLSGLAIGLGLAVVAVAIGTLLGLLSAFASVAPYRALRSLAALYVSLVRNLPLLVLVLLAYFALPQTGITLDKYQSFVGALALYSGAYLTEVFRAGLISVPKGVIEAARSIGLTRLQTNVSVVAPIMLRNALPSLGNTFIGMFKDSSIAAAIAVPELTFEARKINVDTFRVIETWTVASGLYIAACVVIAMLLRGLERRFPKF
ncbi:amino acid ABC transporter permease [Bosea thiooxidans]|uniref:Amino acid ABC transporter permease n=1 Tax=Bosea thiooxidans TaxID=53254 RepID=A0A0Q3KFF1_9HYPH|nr:amino acid ABC transporter permease [Bosea thiooxidans]KQK28547.1 amino acid ABC transporter permease [Bosea thiooxidans]SKC13730.1 polar amino acid transport system permease protein [Bosea thiooxidans]